MKDRRKKKLKIEEGKMKERKFKIEERRK